MGKLRLNHFAIWLAIVLQFVVGFLWYGPLFGERWMLLVGLDMATIEANPPGAAIWFTNVLSSVASMYLLAYLFVKIDIRSASKGLFTGFLLAFVFIFLSSLTNNLFAQFPYELAWITAGFSIVGFSIAGLIFGAWKKIEITR